MKPTKPTDYAALVPQRFRDHTVEKVGRQQAAAEKYDRKKKVSANIDGMRIKKGDTEGADAMRDDDRAQLAVQIKADDAKVAESKERVADEAERKKRGRRPSRRQRKADAFRERGERLHRRMVEHVQSYAQKLRQNGQHDADPEPIPPAVHRIAELIMADPTCHTGRIQLAQLPRAQARQVMRAALHPEPYQAKRKQEGRELRTPKQSKLDGHRKHWIAAGARRWTHPAAIRTIAIGCAAWRLSKRTRRKGFSRVIRGVPRKMFCALAQDHDTGVRPSTSTLYGNLDGVPGAVRALAESGFFLTDQPPGGKVKPRDRGPSGYAFNCYWIRPYGIGPDDPDPDEPDEMDTDEMDRLAGAGLSLSEAMGRAPPIAATAA